MHVQGDVQFALADPICTFAFAALVRLMTRGILRDISDILMERVPRSQDMQAITLGLLKVCCLLPLHPYRRNCPAGSQAALILLMECAPPSLNIHNSMILSSPALLFWQRHHDKSRTLMLMQRHYQACSEVLVQTLLCVQPL